MRSSIASTLVLAGALTLATLACQQLQADPRPDGPGSASSANSAQASKPKGTASMNSAAWKEVDRLLEEAKNQEASDRLGKLIASARAAGEDTDWAKALV